MSRKLMNFGHQIQTEISTLETTHVAMNGWFSNYPKFVDALFEVAYFPGKQEDPSSPEGMFNAFGYHTLIRFPYTVRATCMLLENGFYFEAASLIRNLCESLFQLRYFHRHQDKLMPHILGKHRVRFKTMFDEIAPGFYDKIYAKQLSEFAHGGFASAIFRTTYHSTDNGETTLGSKYNQSHCLYLVSLLLPVLCGILKSVPIFFPQYLSLVPEETEAKRQESIGWLEKAINDGVEQKPTAKKFYDLVSPLIKQ